MNFTKKDWEEYKEYVDKVNEERAIEDRRISIESTYEVMSPLITPSFEGFMDWLTEKKYEK